MYWNRVRAFGAYGVLLSFCILAPSMAQADENEVWALLKKPGHFALLRHANAPGSTAEPYGINLKDCSIQRSLDDAGRTQARHLGAEFHKHGIVKARLVSSQFCRALETARLLGLGTPQELPTLNLVYLADIGKLRDTSAAAIAYMKKMPQNQVVVLVSHEPNIQGIANVDLSSGELAVAHFDAAGAVAVDGRIMVK